MTPKDLDNFMNAKQGTKFLTDNWEAMADLCCRHGLPRLIDIRQTVGKTVKRILDSYPASYIQLTDDTITWFDSENHFDYKPEPTEFFQDLMKEPAFPTAKNALAELQEAVEGRNRERELEVAKRRYEELLSRQKKRHCGS